MGYAARYYLDIASDLGFYVITVGALFSRLSATGATITSFIAPLTGCSTVGLLTPDSIECRRIESKELLARRCSKEQPIGASPLSLVVIDHCLLYGGEGSTVQCDCCDDIIGFEGRFGGSFRTEYSKTVDLGIARAKVLCSGNSHPVSVDTEFACEATV